MVDLRGPHVRLRPLTLDDVDVLAAAAEADPAHMGPKGEEGRRGLRKRVETAPTLEDDGFVGLVVEHDGRPVGDIQARAPKNGMPPGVCEIGISLVPDARGRGIGREAVALFTDHLLGAGWPRVQASTATGNLAMRRVLEHLGFAFEGVLRSYAPAADGGREDYAMYARTLDG